MMLPIIFVIPIVQLLILSYTATFEIKTADIGILDLDRSQHSRALINKFGASPFFKIPIQSQSVQEMNYALQKGIVEEYMVIPHDFSNDLEHGKSPEIQVIADAVNASAASLIVAYTQNIIQDYNKSIRYSGKQNSSVGIQTPYSFWYNPDLNYKTYMVPGILVLLVTMIGAFLSGMNVVKEKEIGTIEQLNVTPIKKSEFIIGKLMPFWIIAMFDLCFGLLLAKLVFSIPFVGSVWLVLVIASIYLVAVLGIGLFISTISDTQQQAMFLAWFMMVVFILMSGLFTPTESMPQWAQLLNTLNPVAYFIKIMRMVMLKGSGLMDVLNEFLAICVYALAAISLSVMRYKKTS